MIEIDCCALKGYEYAETGGSISIGIDVTNDLEVMAFNAGISNYNIRNNKNFPKFIPTKVSCLSKEELDKNPYPFDFMSVQQASI